MELQKWFAMNSDSNFQSLSGNVGESVNRDYRLVNEMMESIKTND